MENTYNHKVVRLVSSGPIVWGVKRAAAAIFFMAYFAGCATAPPFSPAPTPPPGRALVYVYRMDNFPQARMDALLAVNGKRIARLPANRYTWFYVPAGEFRLTQTWDLPQVQRSVQTVEFHAEPGSTHYVRLLVENNAQQMRWQLRDLTLAAPLGELSKYGFQPASASD